MPRKKGMKKLVLRGSVGTRSKTPITYHGRTGRPTIHEGKRKKRFIVVRKKGGGTERLYEGRKYRTTRTKR